MKSELYRNYIKRLLDILLASLALIVLSPILLVTALLIRVKLGSPVVFKQPRPGWHEKIFYLYKFRSMTNEKDEDGRLLPDAQRLTKFGKFLRDSSLDELLELINIIKGDMSIVGPRPLSMYYLPHYPSELRRRHDVRPGLTGLAQVNGRNNLPWDDRFALDIRYVDHISLKIDVKIIFDTVLKVLKRADVTVRGTNNVKDYGPYTILKEEAEGGRQMEGMTYSEIGSYFWLGENGKKYSQGDFSWLPSVTDSCFTFSGRNSIDIAVRDILKSRRIDKVCAPSYCCVSMLQAFIDRGMKIEFYAVDYKDGKFTYQIPDADNNSIVLIMSYFGLDVKGAHEAIEILHKKGTVIIEDITHSLLSNVSSSENSDYLVASLRKWFAVPTGGWVGKLHGDIREKPTIESNHAVEDKIKGMRDKYAYLTGKISTKENFLLANATFENDLIHVERLLKIDDTSWSILTGINVDDVIGRRVANAKVLIKGLHELSGKVCMVPHINFDANVPLFLPIFMKTEDRDSLRSYLISKGIYCPVHWLEIMGAPAGIRENELSLICDQRYSEDDMQVIVNIIQDWYKEQIKSEKKVSIHR